VTDLRPACFVIKSRGGIPLGVIEVKVPGVGATTANSVHLQMLDYLRILRIYPGVGAVFGILITY
jgi:hypothetical protein